MRITLILLVLFCSCLSVLAQEAEVKPHSAKDNDAAPVESVKDQPTTDPVNDKNSVKAETPAVKSESVEAVVSPVTAAAAATATTMTGGGDSTVVAVSLRETLQKEIDSFTSGNEKIMPETVGKTDLRNLYVGINRPAGQTAAGGEEKFHWTPALVQSGIFLGLQTAFRMTEGKTRNELDGPFFRDWKESVQNLEGWDDGGKIFTNYVAHPMQGALTGRIFVNNSERASNREFGASKNYWEGRLKAMAWSAVWSTQFEIGPISEASLGNVGQKRDSFGRSKMTWMDLVLTPTMGTGMLIAEDAIDKYILKNWIERNTKNSFVRHLFRILLNPTTAFANILRGSAPWRRDNRTW